MDKDIRIFRDTILNGDFKEGRKYVSSYLSQTGNFIPLYEEVFRSALYEVGKLWETNKITVADEHLATATVEMLMNEQFPYIITDQQKDYKAVVTSIEGEQHQVGSKMVADVFESHGWDTYFLGSNLPTNELLKYCRAKQPDILALSVSIYFNMAALEQTLQVVRNEFENLYILIGGQAFLHGGKTLFSKYSNLRYFSNLIDLKEFIKEYEK
ncbi:MAG: cobalamin-dependent protein [Bacteroidales bacterium]|nr:cobalamin-dependent protein [Bacteroidales bacterium]MCF8456584.1 cobalamin-dependent protein [Bacteroidales bacterium]